MNPGVLGVLVSGSGTNLQALIDDGLPIGAVDRHSIDENYPDVRVLRSSLRRDVQRETRWEHGIQGRIRYMEIELEPRFPAVLLQRLTQGRPGAAGGNRREHGGCQSQSRKVWRNPPRAYHMCLPRMGL